jgi:hypothetical protein
MSTALTPRRTLTIRTLLSLMSILAILVPTGRWILTPWFVSVATTALGEEIDKRVDAKNVPVLDGIKSTLKDKITELDGRVALLRAQRDRSPQKWTDLDVLQLTQLEQRLATARESLSTFEGQAVQAKASLK